MEESGKPSFHSTAILTGLVVITFAGATAAFLRWSTQAVPSMALPATAAVVASCLWLGWFGVSYENLAPLGRQDVFPVHRRWVLVGWLIPGVNVLVGPVLALGLWTASLDVRRRDGFVGGAGTLLILVLWVLVPVTGFAAGASLDDAPEVEWYQKTVQSPTSDGGYDPLTTRQYRLIPRLEKPVGALAWTSFGLATMYVLGVWWAQGSSRRALDQEAAMPRLGALPLSGDASGSPPPSL